MSRLVSEEDGFGTMRYGQASLEIAYHLEIWENQIEVHGEPDIPGLREIRGTVSGVPLTEMWEVVAGGTAELQLSDGRSLTVIIQNAESGLFVASGGFR